MDTGPALQAGLLCKTIHTLGLSLVLYQHLDPAGKEEAEVRVRVRVRVQMHPSAQSCSKWQPVTWRTLNLRVKKAEIPATKARGKLGDVVWP